MNLIARILSHGFGLIIVALLVVALIYRGELFPGWEMPDFLALDSAPEQAADAVSGEVKRDGEQAVPGEQSDLAAPDVMPPVETTATDGGMASDSAPATVEAEPEAVEAEPVVTEDSAAMPVVDGSAADEAVPAPTAEGGETAADTGAENLSVPETAQAADTGQAEAVPTPAENAPAVTDTTSYSVLAAAREAYWLRDYALAEQKYQDLIALQPDNPDGYGELGNMYFSQGAWEQAAAAYYEAGVRLADQGYVREARQLVEVIRGLNGTQADVLAEKVQSAEHNGR